MASHQQHHDHDHSPSEALTNDDALTKLSETTPLISLMSPGTRRIRSYGNKTTFLPKRRTRARLSKPFNKPQAATFDHCPDVKPRSPLSVNTHNAECELGYDEEQYSSHEVSNTDLTSPTNQAEMSAAWLASNDTKQHFLQQHFPPQLSPYPIPSSVTTPSLRLENKGSVARDHLASERTFLAYTRTSLAIASTGVALVQLFTVASASPLDISPYSRKINSYVRPLGAITVIMGLLVLVTGMIRYFTVQTALTKGFFPVARVTVAAIALALTVLVTLTFAILVAGKLDSKGTLAF